MRSGSQGLPEDKTGLFCNKYVKYCVLSSSVCNVRVTAVPLEHKQDKDLIAGPHSP